MQGHPSREAVVLEVGSRRRDRDVCAYPDTGQAWGPDGPTEYPDRP